MGITSMSEIPSVVVSSGAGNENSKKYCEIEKLTINSQGQYS